MSYSTWHDYDGYGICTSNLKEELEKKDEK